MKNIKNQLFIIILMTIYFSQKTNVFSQGNEENVSHQRANFDGLYIGTNIGVQNIFGGAFIDGLDLLAQKSGFVLETSAGYRWQLFNDRLVLGLELQLGFMDGSLTEFDDRNQSNVSYKGSIQSGKGLVAGLAIGKQKTFLIFSYASITKRNFEIEIIASNGATGSQEDGQRFLQYGLGVEANLSNRLNVRTSIGGVNVDYGDLTTSQDVMDKLDLKLGVVYQF